MTESNETFTLRRWSLADLFEAYDSPDMEAAFSKLESMVSDFEAKRDVLEPGIATDTFMGMVRELEEMSRASNRSGLSRSSGCRRTA